MAAVTICSDFGAQKNKAWQCFHCFPIYLPWSDRTMILIFWMLSFKPTFSLSSFTLIKKLFWGPSPGPQQELLSSRLCHLSPGSYSSLHMLVQEALLTPAHLSAPATTPSSGSLPWPQPTSHTLLSQDSLLAFTFPHRSCHFCNYLAV